MSAVTVSPKYQVVIPKEFRDSMKIHPGQKLMMMEVDERLTLFPVPDIRKMRGVFRGMNLKIEREKDRL